MSLHHILTVARFEVKILFRSWFFRIYSLLLLFVLTFFNLVNSATILQTPNSWNFTGLAVGIPYFSLMALNLSQGVLAIFLASDFLKRDKKLDTTAVVYARPMSNADYVIGKTLSILWVFMVLQAIVLAESLLFHLFVYDREVMWSAYIFLPLALALPSLVYILGLSFVLMRLLRNQAVTFLVLLSYIIVTVWYLGGKYYNFFDYLALHIPLGFSEFTSWTVTSDVLWQRAFYFVVGLGMIGLTAVLLDRLSENVWAPRISAVVTVAIFSVAGFLGFKYLDVTKGNLSRLEETAKLNDEWVNKRVPTITDYDISVSHAGNTLQATSELTLANNHATALKSYVLHLNSGLSVSEVKDQDGKSLEWNREKHLLEVIPTKSLLPKTADKLTIVYKGTINDDLNRLKDFEKESFRILHQKITYQYAFLQSDYVLLPSSIAWYPKAGVGYSPSYPLKEVQQFSSFQVNVETEMPNATVLTQGKSSESNPQKFTSDRLGGMSLIIGEYTKIGKEIDGMEYAIYHHKKHDFFSKQFDLLTDTLDTEITKYKSDFEANLGLDYPYERFSMVEIPIHAALFGTTEAEQIWVGEMAAAYPMFDFKGFDKFRNRRRGSGGNNKEEEEDPKVAQVKLFRRAMNSLMKGMVGFNMELGDEEERNPTNLLNLFYKGVYYLDAPELPYLNASLQQYLKEENQTDKGRRRWGWWGMTFSEKANKKLQENSLDQILKDEDTEKDIKLYAINAQGKMMFHMLKKELGSEAFSSYLANKLSDHQFQALPIESLMDTLDDSGLDMSDYLRPSDKKFEMPAYKIREVEQHKIEVDEYERFQITMEIENPTSVNGLLQISLEPRGEGGRRRRRRDNDEDNTVVRYLKIPANEKIKAGFVMNEQIGRMNVETFVSKNIPSILLYRFEKVEKNKDMKPFEGIVSLPKVNSGITEIVVDNEDKGFSTYSNVQQAGLLEQWINFDKKENDKYKGLNAWNPPSVWEATVLSGFYGDYIQSAFFIKPGKGEQKVSWEAEIEKRGTYEVYVHQNLTAKRRGRRRGSDDAKMSDYNYKVFHDDGEEEITQRNDDFVDGWNYLGTFYYSEGKAKIELSDEGSGEGAIIADAVKWVRLQD
ncbi:golvesin C-terminal-like domain-containing protein [Sediminitomix flava]|uniref:ABC-type transport system involved in multi-copper enzyme maturation permease subunit n=1 Tax=Sediminitomix flava TaxID=379075 RepID=A0A315Z8S2_SEDFL|nr:hypothetical protein [Sediminitomix flava]PWJ41965.1 ABC-type transport system involved in multi-copper enzyme maturation permease subunit [Sediminitomix flava]